MNNNVVGWFEIPVTNMDRAIKFYETVLDVKLTRNAFDSLDMAWFPWAEGGLGSSGSLVCNPEYYTPAVNGVLIYFTSQTGDLNDELNRVEQAGGTIAMPKTLISEEIGYMGGFFDTEGNRIALHSMK